MASLYKLVNENYDSAQLVVILAAAASHRTVLSQISSFDDFWSVHYETILSVLIQCEKKSTPVQYSESVSTSNVFPSLSRDLKYSSNTIQSSNGPQRLLQNRLVKYHTDDALVHSNHQPMAFNPSIDHDIHTSVHGSNISVDDSSIGPMVDIGGPY